MTEFDVTPQLDNMGGLNPVRGFNHHLNSLNSGIDTLEIGFDLVSKKRGHYQDIESAHDFWYLLERSKAAVPDDQLVMLFPRLQVPNSDFIFSISKFGSKPYTYRLTSQYCDILFANKPTVTHMPPIHVRFNAWGLASFTTGSLIASVKSALSLWLKVEVAQISRLDYFLDFEGYEFSSDDITNFLSRAKFKPIYPNVESPETFQFGKGSLVLRIYNKTAEIKQNPTKAWTISTWYNYQHFTNVWRCEFQMRREFLKEFGVDDLDAWSRQRLEIFGYVCNWVRHSFDIYKCNHDKKPTNSPVWDFVAENLAHGKILYRRPKKIISPEMKNITQSIIGLLVSAGVALDNENFQDVFHRVIEESEHYSTKDFSERVRQRALERGKPLSLNGIGAS